MAPDADQLYCIRCLTTFTGDPDRCPNLSCGRSRPGKGWGRIHRAGEVFDRNYKLHRMLAVGGAGVTYVARELDGDGVEVGPLLAIKVLLAARDQGPYLRRLATEAQIIQELDDPHIVQYLGFVHRAGHSPYLITHFEPGGSLLDHMRRVGTLPLRRAAGITRQICWALVKAHERGIVHRDLKPENVLLTRDFAPEEEPVIRVADFGIAKVQGSLGSNLTRVGAFVGTPHYAAPEQFIGGAITKAADVYALGALLHFLLTARHVVRFADRLDPADSFQLLSDNLPPVLELPNESPVDVERLNRILAVAMAVEPGQRCSVEQLDDMLGAMLAGREPTFIPPEPMRSLPTTASVLGLAGAAEGLSAHPGDTPVAALPEPKRKSRLGLWVGLLLILVLGVVAVGGVAWVARDRFGGPPVELTSQQADPAARADWRNLKRSFDNLHGWLQQQCDIPGGTRVEISLVVDGRGKVRSAVPVVGAPETNTQVDTCVAQALKRADFARSGEGRVQVTLTQRW